MRNNKGISTPVLMLFFWGGSVAWADQVQDLLKLSDSSRADQYYYSEKPVSKALLHRYDINPDGKTGEYNKYYASNNSFKKYGYDASHYYGAGYRLYNQRIDQQVRDDMNNFKLSEEKKNVRLVDFLLGMERYQAQVHVQDEESDNSTTSNEKEETSRKFDYHPFRFRVMAWGNADNVTSNVYAKNTGAYDLLYLVLNKTAWDGQQKSEGAGNGGLEVLDISESQWQFDVTESLSSTVEDFTIRKDIRPTPCVVGGSDTPVIAYDVPGEFEWVDDLTTKTTTQAEDGPVLVFDIVLTWNTSFSAPPPTPEKKKIVKISGRRGSLQRCLRGKGLQEATRIAWYPTPAELTAGQLLALTESNGILGLSIDARPPEESSTRQLVLLREFVGHNRGRILD